MMHAAAKISLDSTGDGRLSVLVADDHRYFRESLVSYLTDLLNTRIAGSAATGDEAVALVDELKPDLVIMDIQMPEMDGLTACRLLKARHPDLRIILYSMNTPENYDTEALDSADCFIPKERLFEELGEQLGKIFRRSL